MRSIKKLFVSSLLILSTVVVSALPAATNAAWRDSNTRAFSIYGFAGELEGVTGGVNALLDPDDNVIAWGSTGGTVQLDPSPSDPTSAATMVGIGADWVPYLAKYSSSGELLWGHHWPDLVGVFSLLDVATTSAGEIIAIGYVDSAGVDVDPSSSGVHTVTNANSGLIMKFNTSGSLLWVREFAATTTIYVGNLLITPDGSLIVGGNFEGTLDLDGPGGASGMTYTSTAQTDFFVGKFDANGVEQWAATGSSSGRDYVADMDLYPNGDIVIVTGYRDTMTLRDGAGNTSSVSPLPIVDATLIWKLSASGDGKWIATPTTGRGVGENPQNLVLQNNGKLLVSIRSSSHILALNDIGTVESVMQTEGDLMSMAELSSGTIVMSGSFTSTVDLDPTSGVDRYTSVGLSDGFITLLSSGLTYIKTITVSGATAQWIQSLHPTSEGGWMSGGFSSAASVNVSTATSNPIFESLSGTDSLGLIIRHNADGSLNVPVPSAPIVETYVPGNKQVSLQWDSQKYGSRYVVTDQSGVTKCDTTTTSCEITGLRNGKTYIFNVTAYNSAGVPSTTATSVQVVPGFQVKTTTWRIRKKAKLASIVTTPSKGKKSWRVLSGKCRVSGKRLIMPTKKGRCRLQLTVAQKKPYPKMTTKVIITVTK